ncbi:MAG: hypothetical protein M3430_16345 [Acidobacteriota bacterium]|nr:hypothetical protein [Acidobacteriota bacterium]
MSSYKVRQFRHGAKFTMLAAAVVLTMATAFMARAQQHDAHATHGTPKEKPVQNTAPKQEATPAPTSDAGRSNMDQQKSHGDAHTEHATPKTEETKQVEAPATTNAADHSSHAGVTGAGVKNLMVMSGETMGVRVGASASNFMPMGQMGSGTAWQPASSPTYMWHKQAGEWLLMFHGEAKIGVNAQGGPRGVTKLESQNWFMPMAYRRVGRGTLQLRGMFSFEPFTFSGPGSPQLFQTGEIYKGQPIIDAQHPHDLFMELSAQYTLPIGERGTWYAYVAPVGEPALGPVAFMHRASASENPSAVLSHHLQDSTHISFGVLTSGFTYRWLKIEGSVFNGREPDEHRYGFEFNPWNSRSMRVTVAPNNNWAMQWSYGLLKNPEQLEPGDTRRMTASIQYNRPLTRGNWATSLVWGRNREEHDDETFKLNGYVAESTVNFLDRNYVYTRLELVDKKDLLRHDDLDRLGFDHDFEHPQFRVGAYTFGAARDIWTTDKLSTAIGGDFTFYSKPDTLDAIYGRRPVSYKFFVRFRPGRMKASDHGVGHGGG